MAQESSKYYFIRLPGQASSTAFGAFVEKKMSYCLKKQQDNVALDLSQIAELERVHINIITRGLRNLKSLGGTLVLVGAGPSTLPVLRASKISGACDIYPDLNEFKEKNAEVIMEYDESFSDY